ncbi:hypothetical protein Pan153_36100 [Gimesia panareensis]|uniref:Uncharacterized protein n=1 Tax=Gimesia panareensis TaxID=2527978 RepID=A0A518FRH8_9PLAN|nr:hypothetical protein [Gimesia panareensis]QDV18949.1 hypothetical protein Pan153_36100 [Gimesia panareensis]
MAQYTQICSDCGATVVVNYYQHLTGGELLWSGQSTCESCGANIEFDDRGDLPEELKPAILAEEGEWQLVLDDRNDIVPALRVIRERLQVPLQESKAILNDLRGTKTTLAWIQDGLRQENISSTLIPCK